MQLERSGEDLVGQEEAKKRLPRACFGRVSKNEETISIGDRSAYYSIMK